MTTLQNAHSPHPLDPAWREALSALVDGECHSDELTALLQLAAPQMGVCAAWREYHVVGAALRGTVDWPVLPASTDFVAAVMARLAGQDGAGQSPAEARLLTT